MKLAPHGSHALRVDTLPSHTVPARGRGYFDVQVPESSSYRVDVESFEFAEGNGAN